MEKIQIYRDIQNIFTHTYIYIYIIHNDRIYKFYLQQQILLIQIIIN